jgi:hypothetical protein
MFADYCPASMNFPDFPAGPKESLNFLGGVVRSIPPLESSSCERLQPPTPLMSSKQSASMPGLNVMNLFQVSGLAGKESLTLGLSPQKSSWLARKGGSDI